MRRGHPLREELEFVRAFLLIIHIKPLQGFVQFAADFAAGVKIGKCFREKRAVAHQLRGCPASRSCGFHAVTTRRNAGELLAAAAISHASTMLTPALMSASRATASRDSASECRAVPSSGTGRSRIPSVRASFRRACFGRRKSAARRRDRSARERARPWPTARIRLAMNCERGKRQNDQKNKGGKVNQNDRINELRNHQLRDAGAFVVIIGEQPETGVEPSAAFAGLNQRDVKLGQPAPMRKVRRRSGPRQGRRASVEAVRGTKRRADGV